MEKVFVKEGDIAHLVAAAYALSEPVGMGYLHFRPGDMDDRTLEIITEQADSKIKAAKAREEEQPGYFKDFSTAVVAMDYVHGRCCKFNVWYSQGRFYITEPWHDHEGWQFDELLDRCGIKREVA